MLPLGCLEIKMTADAYYECSLEGVAWMYNGSGRTANRHNFFSSDFLLVVKQNAAKDLLPPPHNSALSISEEASENKLNYILFI